MNPDLIQSLHPPRFPTEFTQPGWDELLAGFGLGLLLAALIVTALTPLLRKRPRVPGIAGKIKAAETLPMPERMLTLARLLAERGGTLSEAQRHALYSGEDGDPAGIEAQIRQLRWGRR